MSISSFKLIRILLLIFGLFFLNSHQSWAQLPVGYSADQIQTGYNSIMGVVFNEDGTKMFVWEKRGHVYVSNWNGSTYIKQTQPVLDISDEVGNWRDFGFASFCLDPDFENNGLVYMFYMVDREHLTSLVDCDDASSQQECENNPPSVPSPYDANDNDYYEATISRVTRYKINIGSNPLTTDYSSRTVLLGETASTGVPLTHESHAGGTILFGSDGTLLVTTGDNASYNTVDAGSIGHTYYEQALADGILRSAENVGSFRSQMPTSLCGKLLRLDPSTGDGLASNPFYDSNNPRSPESRMWAMGLRNPFRMSIEPGSGSTNPADGDPGIIHVADVGWGTWEDLHIFDKAGLNGGWPLYEGQTVHTGYWNTGTINPDEGVLFRDNCLQPTSFVDDIDPTMRRFVHNRPEVAWKHGGTNEARVPWFSGTTATDPKIGDPGSPTTGINFTGHTATGGVFIEGDALGSSMTGTYWFTDYVRNWINVATLTDGSLNWISDVSEMAPANFGSGIVQMYQNPLDGFVYYVNIYNGTLYRISFIGPTWSNEPSDMTVECDGTSDPGGAFATWLNSFNGTVTCGNPTVNNNSSGLNNPCGTAGSETVTFTLEDECGNVKVKQATFTIEDTTDPTFDQALPANDTVECDAIPTEAVLTASDTCSTASVLFDESSSAGSCTNEQIITRTWTATDECGNETEHVQTLTVVDNTDPTFDQALPANDTVECDAIPTEAVLTASDTCGTASVLFDESSSAGSCTNEQIITRTWTATDECGNETEHVQTLTVVDNTDPTFDQALPANDTVECDAIPTEAILTASDTCGTASVLFDESSSAGSCTNEQIITRTWTATDECGNETEHVQTLTVVDNTDPTFDQALPANDTVECDAIPTEAILTASDTCGTASVLFDESSSAGSCTNEQIITRTWTATDECGNETEHVQTLTVVDNTDPTFDQALPANDTVECDAIPTEAVLTASDTCGTASVLFDESSSAGSCTNEQIITRTWTATDECGNETEHVQTLTVVDNRDPSWILIPSDSTVECSADPDSDFNVWLASFSGSDSCGTVSITHDSSGTIACGESEIVQFTLTDVCGNSINQSATFTVEETLNIENSSRLGFKIYPNPAKDHIIIEGLQDIGRIKVYNISGQLVMDNVVINKRPLAVELPSGLYLIKIASATKSVTKKLIIQ